MCPIPREFEDIFIDNLHRANRKGLLISWAIVGQGGSGHVNEKPIEDTIQKFVDLGYMYNKEISESLRKGAEFYWFKNTVCFFEKPPSLSYNL